MKPPAQTHRGFIKQRKKTYSMRFNLFDLHDSEKDDCLRKCLRIYGVTPWYVNYPKDEMLEAYKQAIWLNKKLGEINLKLKKEIAPDWTKRWVEVIPYKIKRVSIKDWFLGRSSPPLIAIEKLKEFGCEKEAEEILSNVEYVSSTTHDIVKIPREPSMDILYLAGLILGDGCLPDAFRKDEDNWIYVFSISGGDKEFFESVIIPLIEKTFCIRNILLYFYNRTWNVDKKNKAIFRFFTRIIGLPSGKKSIKAHVPNWIKEAGLEVSVPFIAGLIDSDIGKHRRTLGCTFRSERFVEDLVELFNLCGVNTVKGGTYLIKEKYPQTDFWIPKKGVKALKNLLTQTYLPKSKDRLKAIDDILQG